MKKLKMKRLSMKAVICLIVGGILISLITDFIVVFFFDDTSANVQRIINYVITIPSIVFLILILEKLKIS